MKKLLSFLKYALLLAVSALLMWYALKELDFKKVWEELHNADYVWVGVSLVMGAAAYFSRAHRWKMQIDPTGYHPSFANTYNAMMVCYLANLVLPRAGEVIRCSMLKRTDDVPVNTALGTVIAERFIDMIMLAVAVGLAFLFEFYRIRDFFLDLLTDKYNSLEQAGASLYWLGVLLIVLMVVLLISGAIFLKRLRRNTYFLKIVSFMKGILQGVFSVAKVKNQGLFWGHTVFVWFMYYTSSLVVFYALPGTSDLSWSAGLSVLVVGSLGMAAPVQGGVGVYHLLVQSTLLLYGVPKEAGMAFALLAHTSQTLLVVVMGVLSFIASMLQRNKVAVQPAEVEQTAHYHELDR
ncbi:lysylphosphatidylglycerol synthase transmembrane domain-containing protein [Pontibacter silvestris]|uniref:Lysylphosphatidylglycerol synthase transmembrane domain-containing protein n=1 Tax=Pontibacter silvestris TaxID=2305183 RepID=A0ABW4WVW7_9BACT|nr:lysylphosphatidylglycerol synthase transmembrane domain-containing protein [Pontibacter silvestris]MCC9136666.1 flippase-like domain-containing protein [Pontibacter silvestris]